MVGIPYPPDTDEPEINLSPEIEAQRRLTEWFIAQDPTTIILTPRQKVAVPGGGWEVVDLPPRPPQVFKMIQQGAAFTGQVESGDGFERQYEFVICGRYDAVLDIGDHWFDPNGQHWEIGGMIPYNGYEVKAGVYSFGKYPGNG